MSCQVTYKALEQFSESEFDLDRLEENVKKTRRSQNLETVLITPPETKPRCIKYVIMDEDLVPQFY